MAYFLDKSKVALEFLQHRGSKLKFINLERNYQFFFDFQPVTLPIYQTGRSKGSHVFRLIFQGRCCQQLVEYRGLEIDF